MPNPSLSGLTPLDAAGSERFRKRLEGLVRFHERSIDRFMNATFWGRLRNQLGLESIVTEPGQDLDIVSIADYSVAQLGELKELELSDEDLLLAYQTALRLDAPTTAERFARVILQRPSMGERIDRVGVCVRLADLQLAEGASEQAERILRTALADSSLTQAADAKAKLEGRLAKCLLERGQSAEAVELYRDIFGRSDNLEVVAGAVEAMMRLGQWGEALEFAEYGRKQAEELRERDFQGQFRSYLEEIRSRK